MMRLYALADINLCCCRFSPKDRNPLLGGWSRAHTSKLELQGLTGSLGGIYSGIELCLQLPYAFQISG